MKFGGSYTQLASSPGSESSGRLWAVHAAKASSGIDFVRSGTPFTEKVPASYSRSSGATSSRCAASPRALSTTRSQALCTATPATARLRLP